MADIKILVWKVREPPGEPELRDRRESGRDAFSYGADANQESPIWIFLAANE